MPKTNHSHEPVPPSPGKPRFTGLKIWMITTALAMVAGVVYFEQVGRTYRDKLAEKRSAFTAAQDRQAALSDTLNKRSIFFANSFMLDAPRRFTFKAADFIRRLSLIVRPDLELTLAEIEASGPAITFSLHCRFPDGSSGGERIFQDFFDRLGNFADLVQLDYVELKKEAPRSTGDDGDLHYRVEGEMTLE